MDGILKKGLGIVYNSKCKTDARWTAAAEMVPGPDVRQTWETDSIAEATSRGGGEVESRQPEKQAKDWPTTSSLFPTRASGTQAALRGYLVPSGTCLCFPHFPEEQSWGQSWCLGVSAQVTLYLVPQLSRTGLCFCLTWVETMLTSCRSWVTFALNRSSWLRSKMISPLVQSCKGCLSF